MLVPKYLEGKVRVFNVSMVDCTSYTARFALNIKGIPYKTEWTEYPDIAQVYQKHGLSPLYKKDDGSDLYTLPVIYDPSTGKAIPESTEIAKYLDKTYPDTPTLFPPGTHAFHATFRVALGRVHKAIWYIVCCAVCYRLNERSQIFYRRTREAEEGKKLEEIRGEKEWENIEAAYEALAGWLGNNGEGQDDYVMGEGICFADVHIVSGLMWAKTSLGEDSEEWARFCSWNNGKWKRLVDNFAKFAHVDM